MASSWSRLSDGSWGVRVEGRGMGNLSGQRRDDVRKRDGNFSTVTLGALVREGAMASIYTVARKPRKGDEGMQPLTERSERTYHVSVVVTNDKGQSVAWTMPIEARDEYLVSETSIDIARCAVHVRDVLATQPKAVSLGNTTNGKAPARRSAARKPAAKKGA